ncbi:19975_t:CDS:2 [Dentiscutata erythropus]|uniref:19975_t:CDS:1 n=1 Tax=Dentiscutata erythropus TaxID=1348616 RepID=A0A9N9NHK1_9GLOM|nr:19975_t:CDS:2 [Dentiscutata erythropus]
MKSLFLILVIFTITVHAFRDQYNCFFDISDEDDLTCEKLFGVDSCSDCQKLIFKDFKEENDCSTTFNFIKEVTKEVKESGKSKEEIDPYDLTYFKKGLENYCDQPFNCDPHTVKKYWTEIEDVCSKELSEKVDWSSDPTKIDVTELLVYSTLLNYYFGIPANHALCYKPSNSDDFCVVGITENLMEYAKEVTDSDPKPKFTIDFKYIIKSDGSKVPVPKKVFCDEKCFESMAKIYKSWIKKYKLDSEVFENIYGSEEGFNDYLDCKTEDKRDVFRRTSDSYLSPLHSLAGLF